MRIQVRGSEAHTSPRLSYYTRPKLISKNLDVVCDVLYAVCGRWCGRQSAVCGGSCTVGGMCYAVRGMVYAVIAVGYAVHGVRHVVCGWGYVVCGRRYAIWDM